MITKASGKPGKIRVTFSLPAAIWADTIHLVGDFNAWDNTATALRLDDGDWRVTLELDAGRAYHYRYLVNGVEWINDWNVDRYASIDYGVDDSVVVALLPDDMPYPEIGQPAALQQPELWVLHGRQLERRAG